MPDWLAALVTVGGGLLLVALGMREGRRRQMAELNRSEWITVMVARIARRLRPGETAEVLVTRKGDNLVEVVAYKRTGVGDA